MADESSAAPAPAPPVVSVRVAIWDLPTRLVHWGLVALIPFSWWTAETGRLEWHRWSGYALLSLLLFRLYWGFAGGSTARFRNFVRGPRAVAAYLRGTASAGPGHNPLGALSVLLLLGLMLVQIVLGLFAVDVDGIESGPLSAWVSFEAGREAAEWHEAVFNVLMTVIVLHILAVFYYLFFRKNNLVGAMVSGSRRLDEPAEPLRRASWIHFFLGVILSAALTWAVTRAFEFG